MIADSKGDPPRPAVLHVPRLRRHPCTRTRRRRSTSAKYRGRYDEGWDVARERWFAKQKATGVIPADTVLAPRNPGVEAWDELTDNERRLAARLQEAFAAFLDHTDVQIGRLVDGLRRSGSSTTRSSSCTSDNGASQEGGPFGVMHEMKFFNGIIETPDEAVERHRHIGGPNSHTNYPWGWAQAGNTPFRWYKQNTHEGGVHVPMIVPLAAGRARRAARHQRDQFVFVADIVPTIYDLIGVQPPEVRKGLEQMPVTGHPFSAVLADPAAPAANTRPVLRERRQHGV